MFEMSAGYEPVDLDHPDSEDYQHIGKPTQNFLEEIRKISARVIRGDLHYKVGLKEVREGWNNCINTSSSWNR